MHSRQVPVTATRVKPRECSKVHNILLVLLQYYNKCTNIELTHSPVQDKCIKKTKSFVSSPRTARTSQLLSLCLSLQVIDLTPLKSLVLITLYISVGYFIFAANKNLRTNRGLIHAYNKFPNKNSQKSRDIIKFTYPYPDGLGAVKSTVRGDIDQHRAVGRYQMRLRSLWVCNHIGQLFLPPCTINMNKGSTIVTVLRVTRHTVGGNGSFNKGFRSLPNSCCERLFK